MYKRQGGKETINDKYVIAGDKTNKGEVDATKVTDTLVSGTLDNQGKSEYDDMTIPVSYTHLDVYKRQVLRQC